MDTWENYFKGAKIARAALERVRDQNPGKHYQRTWAQEDEPPVFTWSPE